MKRIKIKVSREENFKVNMDVIEEVLVKVKKYLLTPREKRGSFDHSVLYNGICELEKDLKMIVTGKL